MLEEDPGVTDEDDFGKLEELNTWTEDEEPIKLEDDSRVLDELDAFIEDDNAMAQEDCIVSPEESFDELDSCSMSKESKVLDDKSSNVSKTTDDEDATKTSEDEASTCEELSMLSCASVPREASSSHAEKIKAKPIKTKKELNSFT